MLYPRQYGEGSDVRPIANCPLISTTSVQIKYLRVPDALLDTVQEEQARAREVNRSHRGGAGPGARGV
jgi:hypothetical protein